MGRPALYLIIAAITLAGMLVPEFIAIPNMFVVQILAFALGCVAAFIVRLQQLGEVRERAYWLANNRCCRCGYDLRGTPDRCPECGTKSAVPLERRWTDRARRAIHHANGLADSEGCEYIETRHVLAALLMAGDGVGVYAMTLEGADLSMLREAVVRSGATLCESPYKRPMTGPQKEIITRAIAEATAIKDDHIGTEHLMVAIALQADPQLQKTFVASGVVAEKLRDRVESMVVARSASTVG